jgi:hypothetical protein
VDAGSVARRGKLPTTRQARVEQLFSSAQRWHGVGMLARARGDTSNADDAQRIERRILCVAGLLKSPTYQERIPATFITRRKNQSANEFVHDVEEELGFLPGRDMATPAVVRARRKRA